MLLGSGRDVLRSERLLLRPSRRADLDALDAAISESLPELIRWLPWAHDAHSRSDTRRYLRVAQSARAARNAFEYAIVDRSEQTLIGMVSLHRIDWSRRSCGLGYWVRRDAWGNGYATEAGAALLRHALGDLQLNRVEALVALENMASRRVVEKLGFTREGVARGVERIAGKHLDHLQYSLLAADAGSE